MSSFMSIAVPSRNQVRKRAGDLPKQGQPESSPTSVAAAEGATRVSGRHRFAVGQRLAMAPGGRDVARGASTCRVVFLLPFEGSALRYRVRSESETFERIVDEKDLKPIDVHEP